MVRTVYNGVTSTAQSTGVNVNESGRLKRENELLKAINFVEPKRVARRD